MISTSKKSEVQTILKRLLRHPHQLETRVWFRKAFTFLLQLTDKEVIIDAFEPKFINKFVKQGTKINVSVAEVDKMYEFIYTFTLQIIRECEFNGTPAYICKIPSRYNVSTSEIIIEPEKNDNVTVSFKLGDHQFVRRVKYISKDEIGIEGDFYKYKQFIGNTVYNIELKLPFHRVKTSADIILDIEKNFCFHEYAVSSEIENAVFLYAKDMFYRDYRLYNKFNLLEKQNEEIPSEETIFVEKKEPEENETENQTKIFIADDKEIVTEFIKKVLIARTNYAVHTETDPKKIINAIKKQTPDLILLDYDMPGVSAENILKEISLINEVKNKPVLLMDSGSEEINISDLNVNDILAKPVNSSELLGKIEIALEAAGISENIPERDIILCTDQKDLKIALSASLENRNIHAHEIDNPGRLINFPAEYKTDLIFIYLKARLLPIITSIKNLKKYENTKIIAVPRSGTDLKGLRLLDNKDLIIWDSLPEKEEIIEKIIRLLEE
ncbi:MAG: hypothetical protein CSB55_06180 [Candidatus Cloacimonadota bacterium]|nr:MAG: hypothetical protein CSB55_06180 [Candidatus Cloacimonadota bacterium]